jgi:D-amino-acid dehydrogenase
MGRQTTLADIQWLRQWKTRRGTDRALQDALHTHRLIEFSQRQLSATALATKIEFERSERVLVLANTNGDLQAVQKKAGILKNWGVAVRSITPEEIAKIEPSLQTTGGFMGAIYLPGDEVGNCRQFALHLKNELQSMGVQVRFDTMVLNIQSGTQPRIHLKNQAAPMEFDHIVVCSGTNTRALLQDLKIKLPMATVSSYSLSARIKEELNAPRSAVYSVSDCTTIVRMGNRVRVSHGAELGTPTEKHDERSVQHLYQCLQKYFPGAADYSGGLQVWKGAFALMADGLPVVGQSALPNLWLNLGHGPNGWAMACGAAKCIADAIGNRTPSIEIAPYDPLRF